MNPMTKSRRERPKLVAINFGELTYRKAVVRPYEPKKNIKKKGGPSGQAPREGSRDSE